MQSNYCFRCSDLFDIIAKTDPVLLPQNILGTITSNLADLTNSEILGLVPKFIILNNTACIRPFFIYLYTLHCKNTCLPTVIFCKKYLYSY